MNIDIPIALWPEEQPAVSFGELIELSGLNEAELRELIDCGLIEPAVDAPAQESFRAECLVLIQRARRLRNDFELDAQGLALVVSLLERVHDLQVQVCELRARLPRRF